MSTVTRITPGKKGLWEDVVTVYPIGKFDHQVSCRLEEMQ